MEDRIFTFFELTESRTERRIRFYSIISEKKCSGQKKGLASLTARGRSLDAAVPGLEVPTADPALDRYTEVPVGAQAPLG